MAALSSGGRYKVVFSIALYGTTYGTSAQSKPIQERWASTLGGLNVPRPIEGDDVDRVYTKLDLRGNPVTSSFASSVSFWDNVAAKPLQRVAMFAQ
jgi:hypothetical protein